MYVLFLFCLVLCASHLLTRYVAGHEVRPVLPDDNHVCASANPFCHRMYAKPNNDSLSWL